MEEEKETLKWWKIVLILIIVILSVLILIILFSNLVALNSITKLPQILNQNTNYSNLGIDENGKYDCSFKEQFNGICKFKCIKSCELINNKEGNNICVC